MSSKECKQSAEIGEKPGNITRYASRPSGFVGIGRRADPVSPNGRLPGMRKLPNVRGYRNATAGIPYTGQDFPLLQPNHEHVKRLR